MWRFWEIKLTYTRRTTVDHEHDTPVNQQKQSLFNLSQPFLHLWHGLCQTRKAKVGYVEGTYEDWTNTELMV